MPTVMEVHDYSVLGAVSLLRCSSDTVGVACERWHHAQATSIKLHLQKPLTSCNTRLCDIYNAFAPILNLAEKDDVVPSEIFDFMPCRLKPFVSRSTPALLLSQNTQTCLPSLCLRYALMKYCSLIFPLLWFLHKRQ